MLYRIRTGKYLKKKVTSMDSDSNMSIIVAGQTDSMVGLLHWFWMAPSESPEHNSKAYYTELTEVFSNV